VKSLQFQSTFNATFMYLTILLIYKLLNREIDLIEQLYTYIIPITWTFIWMHVLFLKIYSTSD
jgi:hypothetical protein